MNKYLLVIDFSIYSHKHLNRLLDDLERIEQLDDMIITSLRIELVLGRFSCCILLLNLLGPIAT